MPYTCFREGCPRPNEQNHYHCSNCEHPEITSMYGHFEGRFTCEERKGDMRRVEKDRQRG